MADTPGRGTDGAPPREIHIEKKPVNWFAWIALLAGILALLFGLSRCNRQETVTPVADNSVVAETPTAARSAAIAGTSGLGAYLAGAQPAPQTFTFDKLNFETGTSTIRPSDKGAVDQVAGALKQYPNAHVRIAGYADSRGSEPANAALGKSRAESVKAALVAQGVDAGRIETATGGDKDPVDTNATAAGRAENRRTELVVTQR